MTSTISIIIHCYNAGRWLAETLESALAQSWSAKESIVINDGSRDDSLAIARRLEPRGVPFQRLTIDYTADYVTRPEPPEAHDCRAVMHHYVAESKRWYFQHSWLHVLASPSPR